MLRMGQGWKKFLGFNVRRPDTKILWPRNSQRISRTWYTQSDISKQVKYSTVQCMLVDMHSR